MILSRAVLEHVPDVRGAAREMARVTRPGGTSLHFLPGRYALFALAARALPFELLLRILHAVNPESRGQVEFEVHYDRCHPAAMERAFGDAGFRAVGVETCWAAPGTSSRSSRCSWSQRLRGARPRAQHPGMASYMVVRAER